MVKQLIRVLIAKVKIMDKEEVEKQINHVKKNLLFFSLYWDDLVLDTNSKKIMMKTIDYLLDRLIELLNKRK